MVEVNCFDDPVLLSHTFVVSSLVFKSYNLVSVIMSCLLHLRYFVL